MRTVLGTVALAAILLWRPAVAQDHPNAADVSHADPATVSFFEAYFAAKSRKDVDATMAYFSPDLLTYTDATLGWDLSSFRVLKGVFAQYMPKWGAGRSYPTRIIGGPSSAIIAFTDTPELFGSELRLLGAVDLRNGKIIRWVDYWDSTTYEETAFGKIRTPQEKFPASFREADAGNNASPRIVDVATRFQKALASGDAAAIREMLTDDAVYEDMALRAQVLGRTAVGAYLSRILPEAPFGSGSTLRHIVGGDKGGGFEWIGGPKHHAVIGVTALELDGDRISRITTTYDGRQFGTAGARALSALVLEP